MPIVNKFDPVAYARRQREALLKRLRIQRKHAELKAEFERKWGSISKETDIELWIIAHQRLEEEEKERDK